MAVHEVDRHAELLRERQRFTALFNLSGLPALTIPVGRTGEMLPVSVQVVAKHAADAMTLRVAAVIEGHGGPVSPYL
jgi:Asp-tRNA(Asn)/Glu-tRNA(Gln) amidotransferase A subunit family amidase